jgi:hypothetical protein
LRTVEVVRDIAAPLPSMVIAELLGFGRVLGKGITERYA